MLHRAICIEALIFEVEVDVSSVFFFSLLIFICLVISLGPLYWVVNVKNNFVQILCSTLLMKENSG